MAYEIYLGGCALYGVSAVEESISRNVTEHDAIGFGVFTMPQNVGLKSWSIKLELTQENLGQADWRKASTVLDELHDMLDNKNGRRLIIISDRQKLSKRVLLRDIKYESSYQGVYSVSLSLIEYVKARVRTAGVPSVTRPGTPPKAPETFKVQSAHDNKEAKKYFEVPDSSIEYPSPTYIDPKTGRAVNPAGLYVDTVVSVANGQQSNNSTTNKAITAAYGGYGAR